MVVQNGNGSDRSGSRVKNKGAGKGFLLRSQVCFVTWSQSRIRDRDEFYRGLVEIMPAGTKIFGSQEFHDDGRPHYHAVLLFPSRVHWSDATKYFMVKRADGQVDTRAIRIQVPEKGEVVEDFLQSTQAYCGKEGDDRVFGKRFGRTVMPSCAKCRRRLGGDDGCFCVGCVSGVRRERVSLIAVCLSSLLRMICSMRTVLLTAVGYSQMVSDQWRVESSDHRKRMLSIQRLCAELSALAREELVERKV
jgi:hypothetical protein